LADWQRRSQDRELGIPHTLFAGSVFLSGLKTQELHMGTTALIVEMVIIGFQVLIWMSILLITIFGYQWIDLSKLKDWSTTISLALIGISYTLGIVFDSFIRTLFGRLEFRKPEIFFDRGALKPDVDFYRMRAYINANSKEIADDLTRRDYRNSLVKATILNMIMIAVTLLVMIVIKFGLLWKLLTIIVLFSVFLIGIALSTWRKQTLAYYKYMMDVYEAIKEAEKTRPREKITSDQKEFETDFIG
jgi:hypothetical protein